MKYFFTIFLSFGVVYSCIAQHKHDYNWLFGYNYLADTPEIEGSQISFNGLPQEITYQEIAFELSTTNTTMSSKTGDLLFYTNGCAVANKNHEVMPNGDGLNPGDIHDEFCPNGYYPGTHQSLISIPVPGEDSLYYIFHQRSRLDTPDEGRTDRIFYSIVDMRLENGFGNVIEKNTILHDDYTQTGEMHAIKHPDGESWWLLANSFSDDVYVRYRIAPDTIMGPFYQSIGIFTPGLTGNGGSGVAFSPDGSKYVRSNGWSNTYLFDFDRNTGLLSNFQELVIDEEIFGRGAAFSPNSRFLYINNAFQLYQFDMEATDINGSMILIDEWDGGATTLPATFYHMQMGPDCRIYMNSTSTVDVLHLIHNPNKKGTDCNFEQQALQLPFSHNISMPHFPYYRMDTDDPICDSSLVVTSTELFRPLRQQVSIFPNPTHGPIHIHLPILPDQPMRIAVFNAFGQVVWSAERRTGDAEQQVDLSGLAAGVYVVQVDMGSAGRVTEKVILK